MLGGEPAAVGMVQSVVALGPAGACNPRPSEEKSSSTAMTEKRQHAPT